MCYISFAVKVHEVSASTFHGGLNLAFIRLSSTSSRDSCHGNWSTTQIIRQFNDDLETFWRHICGSNSIDWPEGAAVYCYLKRKTVIFPGHNALITLRQIADISFPTRWAHFRLLGFEDLDVTRKVEVAPLESALALVLGDIHSSPPVVRIHSQCTTGDVFHSLRCDCHDQLHLALRTIADEGAGILLYEHQEGRGIGLMEKLRAYALQDQGLDTIEANLQLGHPIDLRDYRLPIQILRFLKVRSLRLMTNNPEKVNAMVASGIEIVERMSAEVPASPYSANYLATKRDKLGHFYDAVTQGGEAAPISHQTRFSASGD